MLWCFFIPSPSPQSFFQGACPPLRKSSAARHYFFPAGVVFIRAEWRRVGKRKARSSFSLSWPAAAVLFRRTACVASSFVRSFLGWLILAARTRRTHRRTTQAATSPPGLCRGEIGPVVLCCSQPVVSDSHGCARWLFVCVPLARSTGTTARFVHVRSLEVVAVSIRPSISPPAAPFCALSRTDPHPPPLRRRRCCFPRIVSRPVCWASSSCSPPWL